MDKWHLCSTKRVSTAKYHVLRGNENLDHQIQQLLKATVIGANKDNWTPTSTHFSPDLKHSLLPQDVQGYQLREEVYNPAPDELVSLKMFYSLSLKPDCSEKCEGEVWGSIFGFDIKRKRDSKRRNIKFKSFIYSWPMKNCAGNSSNGHFMIISC